MYFIFKYFFYLWLFLGIVKSVMFLFTFPILLKSHSRTTGIDINPLEIIVLLIACPILLILIVPFVLAYEKADYFKPYTEQFSDEYFCHNKPKI